MYKFILIIFSCLLLSLKPDKSCDCEYNFLDTVNVNHVKAVVTKSYSYKSKCYYNVITLSNPPIYFKNLTRKYIKKDENLIGELFSQYGNNFSK